MRNLLERSLWTGVQTGLALVTVEGLTGGVDARMTLTVALVASALSALKTLAVGRLNILNS